MESVIFEIKERGGLIFKDELFLILIFNNNCKFTGDELEEDDNSLNQKGKRGRPRKHAPKIPLPPLYVFIRNLLHNRAYNPSVVS